jgi:hypothetical protein
MSYRITSTSGTLVSIAYENVAEIDGALELLSSIATEIDGTVAMIGPHNNMFEIRSDPLHLRYQWNPKQGLSVIIPKDINTEEAISFLNHQIEKVNAQHRDDLP